MSEPRRGGWHAHLWRIALVVEVREDAGLLVVEQVDDGRVVGVHDLRRLDAFARVLRLLALDETVYEELLKPLVGEVDADLRGEANGWRERGGAHDGMAAGTVVGRCSPALEPRLLEAIHLEILESEDVEKADVPSWLHVGGAE